MKKSLLLLSALFYIGTGMSQSNQRITTRDISSNQTLVHEIGIVGNKQLFIDECSTLVCRLGEEKKIDVTCNGNIGSQPDLLFIVADDKVPTELIEEARAQWIEPILIITPSYKGKSSDFTGRTLRAKKGSEAATKIIDLLEKEFYQGMRPQYSTVFANQTDGYALYRIPSIVALPDGTIIGITEARGEGTTDCVENDLVCKISKDQGATWGPLIVIAEAGEASLNNPTVIYLQEQGRILLMFQSYPPKTYEGNVKKGLEGNNVCRAFVSHSDDQGLTWSTPKDITTQIKRADAVGVCSGPGVAIRSVVGKDKGRLLFPMNAIGERWYNYVVYSDDNGENFHVVPGESMYGTNESQMIQTGANEYLINARSHRFEGDESLAPAQWNAWANDKLSRCRAHIPLHLNDTGFLWGETELKRALPDPICQGSIIRYSGLKEKERSRVLFSNPANDNTHLTSRNYSQTAPARINGTVRLSYDNGKTWKHSKRYYGNHATQFMYSVLTPLSDGRIGSIFETSEGIRFARFDMNWLTSGQDNGK